MKASVIIDFRDKYHFNVVYSKGDVVDFDAERVSALEKAGVLKRITAEAKTEKEEKDTAEAKTEKGEKDKK